MAYKARFVHGSRYFNLDAGEFDLFQDFIFPTAEEALNATAAPAGSMTGGAVVSKTAQDRWWAWSVRIQGTSGAQTHMAARRLSAWLSGALADKSEELYFEYTPNYIIPAPIWGQHGAPYRWEVKQAIVDLDGSYYEYTIPDTLLIVPISLYVGPYALGARQRLAQAKGGVIEDTSGAVDGLPRGTIIASATTNKMTNPIFGHGTPLNGWTVGVDLTAVGNTDKKFILWGSASAKVTRVSAGANYTFTQSIAAGNTNAHYLQAYVKAYDSSALSSSIVNLYYGASIATTYTALGDGWYRLSAAVTGIAAATLTGVRVAAVNTPIYVAGVQLAEVADLTPFVYGDMIGCSWTGTAHASTSTRVVAYSRIATSGILNPGGGSIRLAIKHLTAAAGHSYDRVLFTDGKLIAIFENNTAKYYFSDGTNTISGGAAQSFVSGDIQVLHFVWGSGGLKTYLNGALYDSGATFTPWTVGDYLYIGSNTTPLGHFNGTFLCPPEIFDQQLTAAQVAADYANISPWIRGGDGYGQRLSSVPYLWTKDGDNQVDNCTQGTTYNHYAIAAGIQGSIDADTEISGDFTQDTHKAIHLSNYASDKYINPVSIHSKLFYDASGTATGATDCGGSVAVVSVTTSATSLYSETAYLPDMQGRSFSILARIKDANGVTGYIRLIPYIDGVNVTSRPMATSDTYALYRTPMIADVNYNISNASNSAVSKEITLKVYRNTGTNNLTIDYMAVFPTPYLYFNNSETGTGTNTFFIHGNKIKTVDVTTGFTRVRSITGNPIELEPNKFNLLQSLIGDVGDSPVISDTLTYDIYYTPRYLIL